MEHYTVCLGINMTGVRINGRRYFCPSSWHEVTVKQYVQIMTQWEPEKDVAERDYSKLLGILIGDQYKGIIKELGINVTLINLVGWVVTEPFKFADRLPLGLKIMGKNVPVPQDFLEVSIGQMIHLRRDFMEKAGFLEENISIAAAILLQPYIDDDKFNLSRAKEIAREIDKMSIVNIYPVGFFLLKHAMSFGKMPTKPWPRILTNLRKMFGRTLRA
jgi:hypothetical protein